MVVFSSSESIIVPDLLLHLPPHVKTPEGRSHAGRNGPLSKLTKRLSNPNS